LCRERVSVLPMDFTLMMKREEIFLHIFFYHSSHSPVSLFYTYNQTTIRKLYGTLHNLTMSITTLVQRVRQRFRGLKSRLFRKTDRDATTSTAHSTAVSADIDIEDTSIPQRERQRDSYSVLSGRSTPLIYRGASSSSIPLQVAERTSIFSFDRSSNVEILDLASHDHDNGTPQNELNPMPSTTTLSIANPDPPPTPEAEQSQAESLDITAPSPSSPGYLLSFEQEESSEETARKREAALRMLEGEIPAVATGAYVRI